MYFSGKEAIIYGNYIVQSCIYILYVRRKSRANLDLAFCVVQRMDFQPTWEPGWHHSMRELVESSVLETPKEKAVLGTLTVVTVVGGGGVRDVRGREGGRVRESATKMETEREKGECPGLHTWKKWG